MKKNKLKKRIRLLEEDLDTAFEAIQALELKVNRPKPFNPIFTMPGSTPDPIFTINTQTIKDGLDTVKVVTDFVTDFGNRFFETKTVKDNDEG